MRSRLAREHESARRLATELARIETLSVLKERPQTNIVILQSPAGWAERFTRAATSAGLVLTPSDGRRVRAVTHADPAACMRAARIIPRLAECAPA